jgi:hypothetical protein
MSNGAGTAAASAAAAAKDDSKTAAAAAGGDRASAAGKAADDGYGFTDQVNALLKKTYHDAESQVKRLPDSVIASTTYAYCWHVQQRAAVSGPLCAFNTMSTCFLWQLARLPSWHCTNLTCCTVTLVCYITHMTCRTAASDAAITVLAIST